MELAPFLVKLYLAITIILGGGPWTADVPVVRLVDQETMAKYKPAVCGKHEAVAYYLGKDKGIILSDKLKPFENAQDAAILIHELQHHVQSKRPPSKRSTLLSDEREAYHVQDRFLNLLGEEPAFTADMLNC